MLKLTKLQLYKILILYTLLVVAGVCSYNIEILLAPARKRSFQCNDESLRKPFVDDTVSSKQLHILGVYFPIVLIAVCELLSSFEERKSLRKSSWILKYVLKCGAVLTLYLIGLAVERLYKNVTKIKMARLRPNFITVCDPVNPDGYACMGLDDSTVMDEYECSSKLYPAWAVSTSFASFPSGHTSLMSYSMVFLIYYLHLLALKLKHFKISLTLATLILQACCLFIMLFVAISRVLDFRHHWSDVFAGFIGGSSVALALNYYLKSQLENIEKWSKVVVCHTTEDIETAKTAHVNENTSTNEKQESCATELVGE